MDLYRSNSIHGSKSDRQNQDTVRSSRKMDRFYKYDRDLMSRTYNRLTSYLFRGDFRARFFNKMRMLLEGCI